VPNALTFDLLAAAVAGQAAAFRSITELQPVEGPGGRVSPPTFSGRRYATEKRSWLAPMEVRSAK
jgi:hypothetical protein